MKQITCSVDCCSLSEDAAGYGMDADERWRGAAMMEGAGVRGGGEGFGADGIVSAGLAREG